MNRPFRFLNLFTKNFLPALILVPVLANAQNIAINTTGAAASSTNMLEVTQSSAAANMVALYAIHNGANAAGQTGYGFQAIKTGATGINVAGYFSASGGGSNYAIIVPSTGGSVGIGTTSPVSLLHVAGSGVPGIRLSTPAATADKTVTLDLLENEVGGVRLYYEGATGNELQINDYAGGANIMTLERAGNVGIGTTTPVSRLHIFNGTSGNTMTNTLSQLDIENSGDAGIMISNPNANNGRLIFGSPGSQYGAGLQWDYTNKNFDVSTNTATANLRFLTGTNVEAARINSSGNMGIGTTSPSQRLDVSGNIKLGDNMMVEGSTAWKVYRNLATFSDNAAAPQGAFVINTTIPWNSAYMFTTTIKGYFYDATAPYEVTLGGYMYTNDNFYNTGYVSSSAKQMTVRLGKNTSTNTIAIILGAEASTYPYPKLTVTECQLGYTTPNDAYADGWSISQLTSLATYSFIATLPNVTTLPTGSGNYIQNQYAAEQSANFMISGNGYMGRLKFKQAGANSGLGGDYYSLYQESGAWASPFPDLVIQYHTGIKYDAYYAYGGHRFYNGYDGSGNPTGLNFSIGDGDQNVRVVNSLMVGSSSASPNRKLEILSGNSDGITIGQVADNTQTIQTYIDGQWTNRATYAGGCCNGLLIQPDVGYVAIGTASPSTSYKLEINGKIKTTSVNESSDVRWKKDIITLDSTLLKVKELRGVSYKWRTDEFKDKDFDDDTQIGLIAQEVEKVYPELVCTDKDGFKSVEYSKLVAVLIEAIKEQQRTIDNQKAQADTFKSDIQSLKASVEFLLEQAAKNK